MLKLTLASACLWMALLVTAFAQAPRGIGRNWRQSWFGREALARDKLNTTRRRFAAVSLRALF